MSKQFWIRHKNSLLKYASQEKPKEENKCPFCKDKPCKKSWCPYTVKKEKNG